MARRSSNVIFVCNNVAQAGRIAQGLGARRGHHEPGHHHSRSRPRSSRHGQKGTGHHHDLTGPQSTAGTLGRARGSTTEAHRSTGTHHSSGAHRTTGTHRGSAERLWKVFHGVTQYKVLDLGTRLEATIDGDDRTVWRGVRLPNGDGYATESTTLVEGQLESFLDLVHTGDLTTPGAQEKPHSAHRTAPASANHAVQRPPAARARKTTQTPASAARPEAPRGEGNASTSTKQGKAKKPKHRANASPKSKAPASAKPKSKAPASAKPKSTRAASPSQRPSPKAKATAKRQPAAKATAHGPATSRSPGSTHVSPASMRRQLLERHPDTPADALATLENIWRGGAYEPTRAWMLAKNIPDLVDAFVDWANHHATEANEYLRAGDAQRAA